MWFTYNLKLKLLIKKNQNTKENKFKKYKILFNIYY